MEVWVVVTTYAPEREYPSSDVSDPFYDLGEARKYAIDKVMEHEEDPEWDYELDQWCAEEPIGISRVEIFKLNIKPEIWVVTWKYLQDRDKNTQILGSAQSMEEAKKIVDEHIRTRSEVLGGRTSPRLMVIPTEWKDRREYSVMWSALEWVERGHSDPVTESMYKIVKLDI